MKTILYFKLNDYENANKYIHASLKYLVFVAKTGALSSEKEHENFEEYKANVLDQYKILTQDKPESQNKIKISLPLNVKYITSQDEELMNGEIQRRVKMRQASH